MNKTIQYFMKNVYGQDLWYAKDKKVALAIYLLSGQKTITFSSKQGLENLGFTFEQVIQ